MKKFMRLSFLDKLQSVLHCWPVSEAAAPLPAQSCSAISRYSSAALARRVLLIPAAPAGRSTGTSLGSRELEQVSQLQASTQQASLLQKPHLKLRTAEGAIKRNYVYRANSAAPPHHRCGGAAAGQNLFPSLIGLSAPCDGSEPPLNRNWRILSPFEPKQQLCPEPTDRS